MSWLQLSLYFVQHHGVKQSTYTVAYMRRASVIMPIRRRRKRSVTIESLLTLMSVMHGSTLMPTSIYDGPVCTVAGLGLNVQFYYVTKYILKYILTVKSR